MINLSGYIVENKIYEGRHTEIYRGIRTSDRAKVIFKILKAKYPSYSDIAKLKYEYEISKRLNDEGIVKVYSLENYENTSMLVLEDFGGQPLNHIIKDGKLNLRLFLHIAIKLSDALGKVHESNIIHRDINPKNVIINLETDRVAIADFGISTLFTMEDNDAESYNKLEGTLLYISPEQTGRMNCKGDYRTDFYSLGITFYEMLAGEPPFKCEDEMELIHCHLARQPVPLNEVNKGIPVVVSNIIMKLIEKDPEKRYQSTEGLKSDLYKCLQQFEASGNIDYFKIGENDISDRFHISQRLYGREQEIKTLIDAFQRIVNGSIEIVLVTGYSGVGKSSLVNEIHKPIVESHGYFISGKYDQYKRNIPYFAIIQAFRGLMKLILTESEDKISTWKGKLQEALGRNGQVITEVIPELETIIGKQIDVPKLPPIESQNRFNLTFQNFLRVLASNDHPLTVFIDDLQWADLASLKLIETLMADSEISNMLLIGAYRDNEVDSSHPLMMTVEGIRNSGTTIETLTLKPLELDHINMLISDSLHSNSSEVRNLAKLCLEKTHGNPFFLNQFLYSLYKEKLIKFDKTSCSWLWSINEIENAGVTDNVVDLITRKIKKLSSNTQEVLKLAACIGGIFNKEIINIVCERTEEDVSSTLWEALAEGVIVPVGDSYKFLHDRVHQATYSLIDDSIKDEVHLKIGRLLLKNIPKNEYEEKIFDIANHFNIGINLITENEELEMLAELNLTAGTKAKASVAYKSALNYFNTGLGIVGERGWEKNYKLSLNLHIESMEAAYIIGDFEEMERLFAIVIKYGKTLIDKAKMYEIKITAYAVQGKPLHAIEIGANALSLFGIKISTRPDNINVLMEFLKTKIALIGKKVDNLLELPKMSNPYKLALQQIIGSTFTGAYLASPALFMVLSFKGVRLSVKYGNDTTHSPIEYSCYGIFLCGIEDIEAGYSFGQLSVNLAQKINSQVIEAQVSFAYQYFIRHWKEHLSLPVKSLLETFYSALEVGELQYAGYAIMGATVDSFFVGIELATLENDFASYVATCKRIKQVAALNVVSLYLQMVLNLRGHVQNVCQLTGSAHDEEMMLQEYNKSNYLYGIFNIYLSKIMLNYIFENYEEAVKNVEKEEKHMEAAMATVLIPVFHFYSSLAMLAVFDTVSKVQQKDILKKVSASINKIKKYAHYAPMNHLHKYYLMKGELSRVLKQDLDAIDCYDKAIELARENGFIQEEAIANEVAARFYFSRGKKKVGYTYLQDAYYCYMKWGATAKVKALEQKYPELFASNFIDKRATITFGTSLTGSATEALDIASILKATQTISGEIILEELLKKLIGIVLENAGAQRVFFIIKKDSELMIEAKGDIADGKISVMQSIPVSESSEIPIGIINYVNRTKESIVLDNAQASDKFMTDEYIASKKPKSILCSPIINKGDLKGILYLENNLVTGAFTQDRIKILNILSSQVAISIENANLYIHLEELVKERTKELSQALDDLKKAQNQLIESEKMAALGQLVASIAHEINSPLGAIQASITNITDYLQETLKAVPQLFKVLTEDQQKIFFDMLDRSVQSSITLSSKEARKIKRALIAEMEEYGINESDTIADMIVDIGIYENIEPFLPLLKADNALFIMQTAYNLSGLQRNARNVDMATARASKMVFALKNYARYDHSGEMTKADIVESIETTLTLYQNQIKQATEVVRHYDNVPQIMCYPDELGQVWTNIIHNALQAMEYNGKLEIDISQEEDWIVVGITDSGKGISDDIKDRIFEPFFTTKSQGEGSGLGLDIVKKIVERHNGAVSVESIPGKTTFTVKLPIDQSKKMVDI